MKKADDDSKSDSKSNSASLGNTIADTIDGGDHPKGVGQQGVMNRTRTCTNPAPQNGGQDCAGEGASIEWSECYDGSWSEYGDWSTCDPITNLRVRVRACNSPSPKGGQACVGDAREVQQCIDADWSQWSDWSACVNGTSQRVRTCDSPMASNGGADCPVATRSSKDGTLARIDDDKASDSNERGDAGSSDRSTGDVNSDGVRQEVEYRVCVNGGYGPWTDWSACDDSTHTRTKHRKCNNPSPQNGGSDCEGDRVRTQTCVDGQWSEFGPFSECSAGRRFRTRTCSNPRPMNGGRHCSAKQRALVPPRTVMGDGEGGRGENSAAVVDGSTEYQTCVSGGWSTWSEWTECNGGTNTRTRYRRCDSPVPINGGRDCDGDATQHMPCVDGDWGPWGDWSECTHTYPAHRTRTRECTAPTPLHGKACVGDRVQSSVCINGGFTEWSAWSACDVHTNQRIRVRTCTSPPPSRGGHDCEGEHREVQLCINGGFSDWGDWSACSVEPRVSHRNRTCTNPSPSNGGFPCSSGDDGGSGSSQVRQCIDGGWSAWSVWSVCAKKEEHDSNNDSDNDSDNYGATDGNSSGEDDASSFVRVRTRECTNPAPENGGNECNGDVVEYQSCEAMATIEFELKIQLPSSSSLLSLSSSPSLSLSSLLAAPSSVVNDSSAILSINGKSVNAVDDKKKTSSGSRSESSINAFDVWEKEAFRTPDLCFAQAVPMMLELEQGSVYLSQTKRIQNIGHPVVTTADVQGANINEDDVIDAAGEDKETKGAEEEKKETNRKKQKNEKNEKRKKGEEKGESIFLFAGTAISKPTKNEKSETDTNINISNITNNTTRITINTNTNANTGADADSMSVQVMVMLPISRVENVFLTLSNPTLVEEFTLALQRAVNNARSHINKSIGWKNEGSDGSDGQGSDSASAKELSSLSECSAQFASLEKSSFRVLNIHLLGDKIEVPVVNVDQIMASDDTEKETVDSDAGDVSSSGLIRKGKQAPQTDGKKLTEDSPGPAKEKETTKETTLLESSGKGETALLSLDGDSANSHAGDDNNSKHDDESRSSGSQHREGIEENNIDGGNTNRVKMGSGDGNSDIVDQTLSSPLSPPTTFWSALEKKVDALKDVPVIDGEGVEVQTLKRQLRSMASRGSGLADVLSEYLPKLDRMKKHSMLMDAVAFAQASSSSTPSSSSSPSPSSSSSLPHLVSASALGAARVKTDISLPTAASKDASRGGNVYHFNVDSDDGEDKDDNADEKSGGDGDGAAGGRMDPEKFLHLKELDAGVVRKARDHSMSANDGKASPSSSLSSNSSSIAAIGIAYSELAPVPLPAHIPASHTGLMKVDNDDDGGDGDAVVASNMVTQDKARLAGLKNKILATLSKNEKENLDDVELTRAEIEARIMKQGSVYDPADDSVQTHIDDNDDGADGRNGASEEDGEHSASFVSSSSASRSKHTRHHKSKRHTHSKTHHGAGTDKTRTKKHKKGKTRHRRSHNRKRRKQIRLMHDI